MGDILLVVVGVFMIAMVVVGLKRGLVKMAFSLVSVIIVLILVNILTPATKGLLEKTPIYESVYESIQGYVKDNIVGNKDNLIQTGDSSQKKIIKELPLPESIKETLVKNNTQKSYNKMEVKSFSDYIASSLTDMVMSALAFVILFIVLMILMKIVVHLLDVVAKLPLIRTFNSAGGALLGLAESLVVLWIACIVVTIFSTTSWGQMVGNAIANNPVLSFIYDHNIIKNVILGIF